MHVLIATASRHGATDEIGEAIAASLREDGVDVTSSRVEDAHDVGQFDAVVIGSAVYMGKWLKAAQTFVAAHADELATLPVWLFSSGPLGDPGKPDDDHAVDIAGMIESLGARDHRIFRGKLDPAGLGFGERTVTRMVRAASGDYRDWDAIRSWADSIASSLLADAGGAGVTRSQAHL
jgi:menaquinone-dependent protoporphyrinogen oxidase